MGEVVPEKKKKDEGPKGNSECILEAMFFLKPGRKGVSLQALKKYIAANFQPIKAAAPFRKALAKLIASGDLVKVSTGRLKMSDDTKKKITKSKKPKKPKKPKKVVTEKKKTKNKKNKKRGGKKKKKKKKKKKS